MEHVAEEVPVMQYMANRLGYRSSACASCLVTQPFAHDRDQFRCSKRKLAFPQPHDTDLAGQAPTHERSGREFLVIPCRTFAGGDDSQPATRSHHLMQGHET